MRSLIILLSTITFLACNKEVEHTSMLQTEFKVDQAKEFIPDAYDIESSLIFQNSLGQEIKLSILKQQSTQKSTHNGNEVKIESITYTLNNEAEGITLAISADHSHNEHLGSLEILTISNNLFSHSPLGYSSLILPIKDYQIMDISGSNIYHENLDLAGNIHTQVMESIVNTNPSSYSKVYYNKQDGIVGFKDKENVIWGLKN